LTRRRTSRSRSSVLGPEITLFIPIRRTVAAAIDDSIATPGSSVEDTNRALIFDCRRQDVVGPNGEGRRIRKILACWRRRCDANIPACATSEPCCDSSKSVHENKLANDRIARRRNPRKHTEIMGPFCDGLHGVHTRRGLIRWDDRRGLNPVVDISTIYIGDIN
jgi:hypothetical protein